MSSTVSVVLVLVCAGVALCSVVSTPGQRLEAAGFKYLGPLASKTRAEMQLFLSPHLLNHQAAYKYCSDVEGRLVSIENHEHRAIVNTYLSTAGYPRVWTSAAFDPSRTWIWMAVNRIMSYQLWYNDDVPAAPTENDCGNFQSGRFQNGLRSTPCDIPYRFVCETTV